jgi:cell division protein FtsB
MLQGILEKSNVNKKSFVIICVCISVILYFLFYTILGNRGVFDYFKLKLTLQERNLTKDKLFIKIEDQKNLVDSMQNESLDIDLLDEQVRKNLGYAKDNEIIIYQDEKNHK